jgi:hypothetical protein
MGLQGPQGATGPAGGAAQVKDATGTVLGTLVGFGRNEIEVYKSGYISRIHPSGKFPVSQIYWTGAACTGSAYLNSGQGNITDGKFAPMYSKTVVFSSSANSLMVASGAQPQTATVNFTAASIENRDDLDGTGTCSVSTGNVSGWPLTAISGPTLGWTVSGTPLSVAGPLQMP